MDLNSVIQIGVSAIKGNSELASGLDSNLIVTALSALVGNGDKLDLSSLMTGLTGGSLGSLASSWLSDEENLPISTESVVSLFGNEKIQTFASTLGLSEDSATNALADAIPAMIDGASKDGAISDDILSSMGGAEGLMGMAGKLF